MIPSKTIERQINLGQILHSCFEINFWLLVFNTHLTRLEMALPLTRTRSRRIILIWSATCATMILFYVRFETHLREK